MASKPITVTLVMLLIVFIISIIYCNIKKMNESFLAPDVPEYDPKQMDENCINYINEIKGWALDFGLPPADSLNDKERRLREEKIKRRAAIISLFTTMKSPTYSIFGQQYSYSDACVIPKINSDIINMKDDSCKLEGNFIKESDIIDGVASIEQSGDYKNKYGDTGIEYLEQYKRKYVVPDKIQIYTPGLFRNVTSLNENDMKPNKGCIIPTKIPEEFFAIIDRIAAIKYFNDDDNTRMIEEARLDETKIKLISVVDRDRAIIARDIAIQQRIAAEQERDRVIIERDAALAKIVVLETEIARLQGVIADKDRVIGDKDRIIGEKDGVIFEKDGVIGDRNRVIGDKDRIIDEKDVQIGKEIALKQQALNEMRALVGRYNDIDNQLRDIIYKLTLVPVFYRGTNFTEESTTFGMKPEDAKLENGNLGDKHQGGFSDDIASVMVPDGYRVSLFTNTGMNGHKYVITGSAAELGKTIKNKASSVRIERIKPNPVNLMPPKVTADPNSDLKKLYGF